MTKLKFNINSPLYVKLTPQGVYYFIKRFQERYEGKSEKDATERLAMMLQQDGTHEFQMHQFMEYFGKLSGLDYDKYFSLVVLIDQSDLTSGL